MAEGYTSGQAPLTYKPDHTQSFEVGSKNGIGNTFRIAGSIYYIKWSGIQQNVYIAGSCACNSPTTWERQSRKDFDLQGDYAIGGGFSVEASVGYTSARFTTTSVKSPGAPALAANGDAISGEAGINYAPGTNPPWTIAIGPQYDFTLAGRKAFARLDWEYTAPQSLARAGSGSNAAAQYNYGFSYTLPATSFTSLRTGMDFGDFQVSAFCDNLFDTHPIINYAFAQADGYKPLGTALAAAECVEFQAADRRRDDDLSPLGLRVAAAPGSAAGFCFTLPARAASLPYASCKAADKIVSPSASTASGMVRGDNSRTTLAAVPQDRRMRPAFLSVRHYRRRQFRVRFLRRGILDQFEGHHGSQSAYIADAGHLLGQSLQDECAFFCPIRAALAHRSSATITSSTACAAAMLIGLPP